MKSKNGLKLRDPAATHAIRCILLFLLAAVVLLCLGGCATSLERRASHMKPSPRLVTASQPIAFRRVIFNILTGKEIGSQYTGLTHKKQKTYYWQSGLLGGSDDFNLIAGQELGKYGYQVMVAENVLFEEDRGLNAKFQLGGIIQDIKYNTYDSLAEANIVVEWQLFDSLKRQVIFSIKTEGYGKIEGTSTGILQAAFKTAILQLLSNETFISLLAPQEVTKTKEVPSKNLILISGRNRKPIPLPGEMEKALQGVVVIRAGTLLASGFLISEDGYLLTAAHAVSGVENVSVQLRSGLRLEGKVLRVDGAQDIALLKVQGQGHQSLPVSISSLPPIGSEVYAIGAPLSEDLSFTVTKGVVSGLRKINNQEYIQTDASINPGNSGGPILDPTGFVVGIICWKISVPGYEGLAFGVPMKIVSDRLGIQW